MVLENIAGCCINVNCVGTGATTLIFVHGLACDHLDWSEQVRVLSANFRVVTFDLPGHGESGPGNGSVESLAHIVCEINARYGRGQTVLVGHSLGCFVILEAFQQSSSGVAGLVLLDASRLAHGDADSAVKLLKQKLDAVGVQLFINAAFQEMFVPQSDPTLRQRVLARARRLDSGLAEQMIMSAVGWDASEAERVLTGVSIPVLVLQSTYLDNNYKCRSITPGMSTSWTELIMEHASEAEFHIVADVGHFAQIEAAEVVNARIRAFSSRVCATHAAGRRFRGPR